MAGVASWMYYVCSCIVVLWYIQYVCQLMLNLCMLVRVLIFYPSCFLVAMYVTVFYLQCLTWFLPANSLKAFYFAYIATSFDYCSLVWDPCCYTDSTRLQRLQNYAGRIILKVPKSSSATKVLSTLNWTSLSDRRQRKLFSLSQELLQPKSGKSAPSYLRNLFTIVSDIHHYYTRGAARGHLHVNQVHREYGKKAISFRLTQLRNSY